jgi:NDP-sugar pyrophosphorylase family protein
MLLAAGRGTRMEPLSSLFAKPALDVLGRPLLARALETLHAAGCAPIVANLHRHPDQVATAVQQAAGRRFGVSFSREPSLLGGAGGVAEARALFRPAPVLVANADVWASLDLSVLLASRDDDTVTLALLPHPDPARWTSVLLEEDGRVGAFHSAGTDPPGTPYLYTGFQLLGAGTVATLPPPPADWRPWWTGLRSRGKLRGAVVSGRWREAGTPAAYLDLVLVELAGGSWAHARAVVASGAVLERSAVGAGCAVGAGAQVSESVVIGGAIVGERARLRRCVVAGPVHLDDGETLADTLILPERRVGLAASVSR